MTDEERLSGKGGKKGPSSRGRQKRPTSSLRNTGRRQQTKKIKTQLREDAPENYPSTRKLKGPHQATSQFEVAWWRKELENIFAKLVVARGLASKEAMEEHWREFQQQGGRSLQFGQFLMQKGLLDTRAFMELHQVRQKLMLNCPQCQKDYSITQLSEIQTIACPGCGSKLNCPEELRQIELGSNKLANIKNFGSYEILEEIARGGMGIVYRARQKSVGREVALKVMRQFDALDPDQISRFQREIFAAGKLQHPNIVPIYDAGEIEQTHYFAMKFIPGKTLAEIISAGSLSVGAGVKIMEKVARAIYHAHRRQIIHRDLKPANIIVYEDEPYITDFGLAKDITAGKQLTQSGAVLGTPYYMAPEQTQGKNREIGAATDIYALGVILYECTTGHFPFSADTLAELYNQISYQQPLSPRKLNPRVPVALETIINKAMAKKSKDRYATAKAFADDLRRYREGKSIIARSVTAPFVKIKGPVGIGLVAVMLLLPLIFYIFSLLSKHPADAHDPETAIQGQLKKIGQTC